MLILLWLTTGVALLAAMVGLLRARSLSRRLERLSESYWELRYEHGQLRSRLAQLEQPGSADAAVQEPAGAGRTAFVPLSSLKR